MSGSIPREFIDSLLMRVDLVDLIDSHVPLKKAGNNYVALCPFHNEKSPSFSVNRSKQFYHCFGCGASGNAVSFLMDYSSLDFVAAVESLAAFIGVDVPREQGKYRNYEQPDTFKELYQLLEDVATFYAKQLRATNPQAQTAIDYLKARGVSGQIAKTFMLGYADEQWHVLAAHFPEQKLLELGLLVSNEKGNQYDRFRGRVMFPIRDKRGRVIGFGGRVLDDSKPKYLNSPESSVFSKGQHVYGLYELSKKKAKPERILIVEGYMDVIALAQFGIGYAVATLGTATSKAHIDLLFRETSELVFCFDGDKAGQQAAWRATETVLPSLRDGRQVRIMLLPEGHDPDSLVRTEGLDNFVKRVISAQALSEYFFAHFTTTLDLSSMEGRTKLIEETRSYLQQLPSGVFKEMMMHRLEQLSQTTRSNFLQSSSTLNRSNNRSHKKDGEQLPLVENAIALLLQHPHLAKMAADEISEWEILDLPNLGILRNLLGTIVNHNCINTGVLIEMYRGLAEENIIKKLASFDFFYSEDDAGVAAEFSGVISKLTQQAKNAKITRLIEKAKNQNLSVAEQDQLKKMLHNK